MIGRLRKSLIASVVVALGLTGCVSNSGGPTPVSAVSSISGSGRGGDRQLAEATEDFDRTVVEGALVGALVGAAIGGATSGWKPQAMLTGAGIGAGTGLLAGYAVAGQKRSYTRREDALNAMIADARTRVAKAERVAARAEALVELRRAEIARLKAAGIAENARAEAAAAIAADRDNLSRAIDAAHGNARNIDDNAAAYSQQFGRTADGLDGARGQIKSSEERLRRADQRLSEIASELGR